MRCKAVDNSDFKETKAFPVLSSRHCGHLLRLRSVPQQLSCLLFATSFNVPWFSTLRSGNAEKEGGGLQ